MNSFCQKNNLSFHVLNVVSLINGASNQVNSHFIFLRLYTYCTLVIFACIEKKKHLQILYNSY